jgi:16S rRNA (cytidine1402-2'-O)-methyltransferase
MARAEQGRRVVPPAHPSSSPGTLFVVATPIGNLEDITLRALRTLREVHLVAAEDTRRTANLLRHYSISTPLVSLHEHNEQARVPRLLTELSSGRSVALVSDAGTPGISDPGAEVVLAVREAGIPVVPIPGPSAVATVASIAGQRDTRFAFAGFPPVRSKDRKRWFAWVASLPDVLVIAFESPHRIHRTLRECARVLVNRPIMLARELTKVHEEVVSGTAEVLINRFPDPKGEFVLVLLPPSPTAETLSPSISDDEVRRIFCQITDNGAASRRAALRETAERLHIPQKAVFGALERTKKSGE